MEHNIEDVGLYVGLCTVTIVSGFVCGIIFLPKEDERMDKLYHYHDIFNRAYEKYYTLPNTSETLIETLKKWIL